MKFKIFLIILLVTLLPRCNQHKDIPSRYEKSEYYIPMRDGTRLFTAVFTPKNQKIAYPIMLMRTPYGVQPYGADNFPATLGPSAYFAEEGFIFVYQDVRGRFMSEGKFINMYPHIPVKKDSLDVDNSTDTYDTVEWLLKNIPNNNGKVGLWGISYPGFYVSTGIIDAHPAIVCASPQAPIADWFIGDDMHHNGALALSMSFSFFEVFGQERDSLTTEWPVIKQYPSRDGYNFFLSIDRLSDINDRYFDDKVPFWDSIIQHGNYDTFWEKRNTLPALCPVKPAVLTICGWFDAEDLYGSINTYKTLEKNASGGINLFVAGPWIHGGWARTKGDSLGPISFESPTATYYQKEIELPFFNYFLKGKGDSNFPEAIVFETGSNTWRKYDQWPPANCMKKPLFLHPDYSLSFSAPDDKSNTSHAFVSDPLNPIPYTAVFHGSNTFYNKEYMVEDQRFAAGRPDVLEYRSAMLDSDITFAGPVEAELFVSTTGTDADWVVKVIDVFPDTVLPDNRDARKTCMAGYQMLVRGEIMRGKYRNNYASPEPFKPGEITRVAFQLQDINHTFKKGHCIMIQVQSSWFPLFDRNPQQFMDIYSAVPDDFKKETHRIYCSRQFPSNIKANILSYVPQGIP
ncbi:MAG: CocE/NonD family hydrolase [Bacteroidales bacterium]|nr:CocE/NonD family hydrolase [Bacteroidales bacterium]